MTAAAAAGELMRVLCPQAPYHFYITHHFLSLPAALTRLNTTKLEQVSLWLRGVTEQSVTPFYDLLVSKVGESVGPSMHLWLMRNDPILDISH